MWSNSSCIRLGGCGFKSHRHWFPSNFPQGDERQGDKKVFFKRWLSLGDHLFDHLLWSIFQSSIKRRWKVEPRSEYLTSSGAICILKILKLLILFISMCVRVKYKKETVASPYKKVSTV